MKQGILLLASLLFISISCSSESDKSLYESAKQFNKQEKFDAGIQNYEKIINEYPDSKYRSEVLFELGKMYQARLIKKMGEVNSYQKSKMYFQKLYKEFPNDKNSGSALFMVAFIQGNLLNQLDSAKVNYEKFIAQYPNHPMLESAKAEIKNLGVPPELIIRK